MILGNDCSTTCHFSTIPLCCRQRTEIDCYNFTKFEIKPASHYLFSPNLSPALRFHSLPILLMVMLVPRLISFQKFAPLFGCLSPLCFMVMIVSLYCFCSIIFPPSLFHCSAILKKHKTWRNMAFGFIATNVSCGVGM